MLQEALFFVILVLGRRGAWWEPPHPGRRLSPLGPVIRLCGFWGVKAGCLYRACEFSLCLLSVCSAGAEHISLLFLPLTVPGKQQKAAPSFLHPTSACEQAPSLPWWAGSDSWLPPGAWCLCDCPIHPEASAGVWIHPAGLLQEACSSVRCCHLSASTSFSGMVGWSGLSSLMGQHKDFTMQKAAQSLLERLAVGLSQHRMLSGWSTAFGLTLSRSLDLGPHKGFLQHAHVWDWRRTTVFNAPSVCQETLLAVLGWLLVQKSCFGDFKCQQPLGSCMDMRASLTAAVTLGKKTYAATAGWGLFWGWGMPPVMRQTHNFGISP